MLLSLSVLVGCGPGATPVPPAFDAGSLSLLGPDAGASRVFAATFDPGTSINSGAGACQGSTHCWLPLVSAAREYQRYDH